MNRMLFEYHSQTGYKFIPNLKTRIQHEAGGYLLRTNALGFRSEHEFSFKKTPGKKRILVFGDSFTAGDGVSNKFRYTDVLETMLPDTEVYNFGLPGSGTDQQYLLFKEYAHQFEYDLLIISVLVENIRRIKSHYRFYLNDKGEKIIFQKPFFDISSGKLELKNTPVHPHPLTMDNLSEEEKGKVDTGGRFERARSLIKKLGLQAIVQKLTKYQPVPEYNNAGSPEWLTMKKILEAWISEANKPVLVIPLPLYQYIEGTSSSVHFQDRFNELTGQCTIFNPLPDLKKYTVEERRNFRFPIDVHPTPSGHAAIAKSIFPIVSKML